MSFVDENLLPDEQIVYRTKKHFIVFLNPFLWTCGTIALFLAANPYVVKVAYLFALIALITWLMQWLEYSVAEFAVTNKRVLMREGFFLKHTTETRIATISNVNIDQNVIGQLLNYGVIILRTYGGNDDPFMDIPKPFEFKKHLEMQLDKVSKPA